MDIKLIFKNAGYLFVGQVLVRIATALSTILVARYLGAESYGIIAVVIAFSGVTAYFTDLGVTHTYIREATKEDADIAVLTASALKVRLLLAFATSVAVVTLIPLFYADQLLRKLLYIATVPAIWGAALQGFGAAYFQLNQEMQFTSLIRVIAGILVASSLITGIIVEAELAFFALSYGVASFIAGTIAFAMVARRQQQFTGWNSGILNNLSVFTIGGLFVMALPQVGPIILSKVAGFAQTGYFSVAYKFPLLLYTIPGTLAAAFYPALFIEGHRNIKKHIELSQYQLRLMSVLGFVLALPFLLFPEPILLIVMGSEWINVGAPTLSIVAWVVILQAINYPLADGLTTQGLQHRRTWSLGIALTVAIIAYYYLGRSFGSIGAGYAAVATECVLMLCLVLFNPVGWKILWRGTVPVCGVGLVFFVLGRVLLG